MNKREVVVYLSGKYRGQTVINVVKARQYAVELWKAGFTVICPHLNTAHFERFCDLQDNDFIEGDIVLLQRCDAIFMIPGWEESIGAKMEYEVAKSQFLPIFYSVKDIQEYYDKIAEKK